MLEKRLSAVSPQSFMANGTSDGVITLADTSQFKVKQEVILSANTLSNLDTIEVKRVMSPTQLAVGPRTGNIDSRTNVSAYTTALNAAIFANEQKRPSIPFEEHGRATYEEEPVVAERSILVDKYGRRIDSRVDSNGIVRLAVDGQFSAEVDVQVDVDVDGYYDPVLNPDPDNIGLIGHTRDANPDQTDQIQRITVKQGVQDPTHRSMDVALHDSVGDGLTSTTSGSKRRLNIDNDGVYDATNNSDPANVGLVTQERNAAPADSRQTMRPTAKRGATDTDTVSQDVSLHDHEGNQFTETNQFPTNSSIRDGTNPAIKASVSVNNDLGTSDVLDHGGVDAIIPLTTTPVELKIGASTLANRKYMVIEALDTNVKWGFSNTTQSFDIFKSQLIMIPVGPNTQVWAKMTAGTGNIAVGELA